jgi:uncharacterized integral membrane protein (TIGR00697 family)
MNNVFLFFISCTIIVGCSRYAAKQGIGLLTAWIAILSLLANFFVLKQITLFGLNATASDVFAIGSMWSLNVLQEQYGKEAAKKAIWASFMGLGFFTVMANIHLAYEPSVFDTSQSAYIALLAPTPRILIGSLLAFFISQQCDRKLFERMKLHFPQLSQPSRSALTLICSQAIDTVLFGLFALYGLLDALAELMLWSFMIKCIAIGAMLPSALLTEQRKRTKTHAC